MVEPDIKEQTKVILSSYSGEKNDLIAILREVQEKFGYLPKEAMQGIARFLGLAESRVYGVATFYADFRLAPGARKMVHVCQGPACHLAGGKRILDGVEAQLGIKPGESTGDKEYGLGITTCSGVCALAPVVEVNENTYGHMTPDKVKQILHDTK